MPQCKVRLGLADPRHANYSVATDSGSPLKKRHKMRGEERRQMIVLAVIQFRGIGAFAIKAVKTLVGDL